MLKVIVSTKQKKVICFKKRHILHTDVYCLNFMLSVYFSFFFITSVCQLSVEGISLFIDITYTGYDFIKNTLRSNNIPHFSFDYSIQSFVKIMELYLKARLTTDVVFIFQNELGKN